MAGYANRYREIIYDRMHDLVEEHDPMVGSSESLIAAHDLRERLEACSKGSLRLRLAGDLHGAAEMQQEAKRLSDYITEVGA